MHVFDLVWSFAKVKCRKNPEKSWKSLEIYL